MDIKIKKLTPELLDDYLNFFDNAAFSDHKEWSLCYCMFFHMTEEMEALFEQTKQVRNRENAIEYIKQGKMNGYLAYHNGEVIGWLNADDKGAYYTLSREKRPELWDETDNGMRTKSLVCFTIAPGMRGKGIATRLLERALADAASEGYDIAEAYPVKGNANCFLHYPGPMGLYEKSGFEVYKELEGSHIIRKALNR